jgi:hypothetical protein
MKNNKIEQMAISKQNNLASPADGWKAHYKK